MKIWALYYSHKHDKPTNNLTTLSKYKKANMALPHFVDTVIVIQHY